MSEEEGKLKNTLEAREKQLADMSMVIGEMNEQLSQLQYSNVELAEKLKQMKDYYEVKEKTLSEELKRKEWMFSKMQGLQSENDRLKATVSSVELFLDRKYKGD